MDNTWLSAVTAVAVTLTCYMQYLAMLPRKPTIIARIDPVDGVEGWQQIHLTVTNRADQPLTLIEIRAPWPSRLRMVHTVDVMTDDQFGGDRLDLSGAASLITRRLSLRRTVEARDAPPRDGTRWVQPAAGNACRLSVYARQAAPGARLKLRFIWAETGRRATATAHLH